MIITRLKAGVAQMIVCPRLTDGFPRLWIMSQRWGRASSTLCEHVKIMILPLMICWTKLMKGSRSGSASCSVWKRTPGWCRDWASYADPYAIRQAAVLPKLLIDEAISTFWAWIFLSTKCRYLDGLDEETRAAVIKKYIPDEPFGGDALKCPIEAVRDIEV